MSWPWREVLCLIIFHFQAGYVTQCHLLTQDRFLLQGRTYKVLDGFYCQAGICDTMPLVDIRLVLATRKGHAKRCLLSRQQQDSPYMKLEETWKMTHMFFE